MGPAQEDALFCHQYYSITDEPAVITGRLKITFLGLPGWHDVISLICRQLVTGSSALNVNSLDRLKYGWQGQVQCMYLVCMMKLSQWAGWTSACLTACLIDIEAWLKASRLRLNSTETQVMWFGSPQQLVKVSILEVLVASAHVSISETARNLGIIMDSQLMLSAQVSAMWLLLATASLTTRQVDVIWRHQDTGPGVYFVSPGLLQLDVLRHHWWSVAR